MSSGSSEPTIVDVVLGRENASPDFELFTFQALDGQRESVTYRTLLTRARSIAASLQQVGQPGDRVLLVCPAGRSFVEAFLGVLLSGRVAVPAATITGKRDQTRLRVMADKTRPVAICASVKHARQLERWLASQQSLRDVRVLFVDTDEVPGSKSLRPLDLLPAERAASVPSRSEDLAFIQFTSGSISTPKGVMVHHRQLMHNLRQVERNFGVGPHARGVIWLPPYHDMGLIGGVLEPVCFGCHVTLMPPVSLMRSPLSWLKTISMDRATISGGPTFAYELCVERVTDADLAELDLSSWELAFVGAEPVHAATLERFAARFAPAGFRAQSLRPCYGMAETVLMVTSTEGGQGLSARAPATGRGADESAPPPEPFVSCGVPQGAEVLAVDTHSLMPLPDGAVGELWIRGPSVTAGYWEQPAATEEAFGAHLADGRGPFLRSGDLAFIEGEEVFVCGRIKELILVEGRNIYPTDVEHAARACIPGARPNCAAAFAVRAGASEGVALVLEAPSQRTTGEELLELEAAIRARVAEILGVELVHVVFIAPHAMPRTTSGKVQRTACREAFASGTLDVLNGEASSRPDASVGAARPRVEGVDAERLTQLLCDELCVLLEVDAGSIDPDVAFADSGCDSRSGAQLLARLKQVTGITCSVDRLFQFSTPRALAGYLAGAATRTTHEPAPAAPAARQSVDDGVAIVGLACRLPGAPDVDSFWRLLVEQRDEIGPFPPERWDRARWYRPQPRAGKMYTDRMGSIAAVDAFDAQFFGIGSRLAAEMDPQQRLMLEVCWEALEDAYIPPSALRGRDVGVFIGASHSDYLRLNPGPASINPHTATGTALSAIAGRVSYVLGLSGPALVIDTACSSSLAAAHAACQALRAGDCSLALCAGVNLILAPEGTVAMCAMRALSSKGRCAAFDEAADGYVRGEGIGVVALKPLSQALTDGDRIYATIAASAINQDGASNGIAAPNANAQEAVIRRALSRVDPATAHNVRFVEAHGTGTPLGDLVEAGALSRAYRPDGNAGDGRPLLVGSVKSNIGHLEAGAGIASLIKTALCIHHGVLVGNANFEQPSRRVQWQELQLDVVRRTQLWEAPPEERVAGISCFGFTGTNVHAVLRGNPPATGRASPERTAEIFTASARCAASLRQLLERYLIWLRRSDDATSLQALCCAAALGRDHQPFRFAVAARDRAELEARIATALDVGDPGMLAGAVELGVVLGEWHAPPPPLPGDRAAPALARGPWQSSLCQLLEELGLAPKVVAARGEAGSSIVRSNGAPSVASCTHLLVVGDWLEPAPAEATVLRIDSASPDPTKDLFQALAVVYQAGAKVGWDALYQHRLLPHRSLPSYAFQRKRYWYPESHPKHMRRRVATMGR